MSRVLARLSFIEPQLASPVDQPPKGKHWIHELKHDGYRCQVLLERGRARVFTRNGYDWSEHYPSIVRAASNLNCKTAIIDGEAVVQDSNGASDFGSLRSAMRRRSNEIILYAFDLLDLNGIDFRRKTLLERRTKLRWLVGVDAESRIQFSEEFEGDGDTLLKACAERKLEGIVSKHTMSRYQSGRSKTWLKTKCFTESTFVVVGTDHDPKTGAPRALLARNDSDGLIYAGMAFIALGGDERTSFFAELQRLTSSWASFKSSRSNDVKWCDPKLTVEVRHLAGSKFLRHATVRRFAR
jgi:bifunctional non-homologous end joining protein LigD